MNRQSFRFTSAVLLILLVSLRLLAVGVEDAPVDSGEVRSTRLVTDCFNRQVSIPEKINTVACLYAFSTHVVTMLGEDERITAVVEGSKRDRLLNEISPHILTAATPSNGGLINIEELLAVNPDLVFLKGETALLDDETAKLDLFSIPYIVIDFNNITTQMRAIEVIGEVIGRAEKAADFNRYYQSVLKSTRVRFSGLKAEEKTRIFHSVNEATRTDAAGTLMVEWTEAAGAVNVSVGQELRIYENKYFAGIEQIITWDPEVIICNEYGVDSYILSNEKWAAITAVKEDRVWIIPTGISRWGHPGGMETPLAILWTAKLLYPDLTMDIDMVEETRSFYKEFFNYMIDDELLGQILSGGRMRIARNNG
jgi:iron complex transport system substrate-binding protein